MNILFVGEMGAGKSTMLRALLQDAAGADGAQPPISFATPSTPAHCSWQKNSTAAGAANRSQIAYTARSARVWVIRRT